MSLPFAYAASRLTLSQHALPLESGVERSTSYEPGLQPGAARRQPLAGKDRFAKRKDFPPSEVSAA